MFTNVYISYYENTDINLYRMSVEDMSNVGFLRRRCKTIEYQDDCIVLHVSLSHYLICILVTYMKHRSRNTEHRQHSVTFVWTIDPKQLLPMQNGSCMTFVQWLYDFFTTRFVMGDIPKLCQYVTRMKMYTLLDCISYVVAYILITEKNKHILKEYVQFLVGGVPRTTLIRIMGFMRFYDWMRLQFRVGNMITSSDFPHITRCEYLSYSVGLSGADLFNLTDGDIDTLAHLPIVPEHDIHLEKPPFIYVDQCKQFSMYLKYISKDHGPCILHVTKNTHIGIWKGVWINHINHTTLLPHPPSMTASDSIESYEEPLFRIIRCCLFQDVKSQE